MISPMITKTLPATQVASPPIVPAPAPSPSATDARPLDQFSPSGPARLPNGVLGVETASGRLVAELGDQPIRLIEGPDFTINGARISIPLNTLRSSTLMPVSPSVLAKTVTGARIGLPWANGSASASVALRDGSLDLDLSGATLNGGAWRQAPPQLTLTTGDGRRYFLELRTSRLVVDQTAHDRSVLEHNLEANTQMSAHDGKLIQQTEQIIATGTPADAARARTMLPGYQAQQADDDRAVARYRAQLEAGQPSLREVPTAYPPRIW
jgi:hypothetical protein